jgi:hypothetical protein
MNLALAPAARLPSTSGFDEVVRSLPSAAISFVVALLCSILAVFYVPAGWLRAPIEALATTAAAQPPAAAAVLASAAGAEAVGRSRTSCTICGVVDHVRRIENGDGLPATFEISIRMRDGSTRASILASADSWRSGDRIMLIGGLATPGAATH